MNTKHPIIAPLLALTALLALAPLAGFTLHGDVFWDLATGRWEWTHHAVLRWNPFSWGDHAPWVNNEWGWGLILYTASRFGPWGLLSVAGLGIVGWWTGLRAVMRRLALPSTAQLGILILSLPFVWPGWSDRPQIWAYAFAVWGWVVLWDWADPRHVWTWRDGIALLGWILWVQIHGSWILIPVWAVILSTRPGVARRRLWGAAIGALGLAAVDNPWGWAYVQKALFTSSSSTIASAIVEWLPPSFHQVFGVWLPWMILLSILTWGMATRPLSIRVEGWRWMMLAGLVGAALYAVRFEPYLPLALALGWPAPSIRFPAIKPPRWVAPALWGIVGMGILLIGIRIAPLRTASLTAPPFVAANVELNPSAEPVAAVVWLQHHPAQARRVFNNYRIGGYLTWMGIPDWIDGRTGFWIQTSHRFTAYATVIDDHTSPRPVIAAAHPTAILAPTTSPWIWGITGWQGWHVAWHQQGWTILVSSTGG